MAELTRLFVEVLFGAIGAEVLIFTWRWWTA